MSNMMRKINQKKNNKGFTLVELIIVIAIIAILVAVLAPQYIKYVSRAEDAVVESAANDILSICKTEAAINGFSADCTVVVDNTGVKLTPTTAYAGDGKTFDDWSDLVGDDSDLTASNSTKKYAIIVNKDEKSAVKSSNAWGVDTLHETIS